MLSKQGKVKTITVHRLVAQAFIPNPDSKPEVNHIDGDKKNNNMSNLEWCTSSENVQHAVDTGLINNKGSNNGKSKLSEKQVLEIRDSNLTQTELGKLYGVPQTVISKIKHRKLWTHI